MHVYVDEALLRGVISDGEDANNISVLGACTDLELRSVIIPDRKAGTLIPILERILVAGSIVVTDSFASYRSLKSRGWDRVVVNHRQRIFVNEDGISQAHIESYWKHLKRSFRGTHLRISRRYIWKYINSFNFIYNRRMRSNEIFWDSVSSFPRFLDSPYPHRDVDLGYQSLVLPDINQKQSSGLRDE